MRRHLLTSLVGIVLAGAMLAACSGDSNGQPNSEAGLKAAVFAADKALFSGDVKGAYMHFSKACRDQVSYTDWAANVAVGQSLSESILKVKWSDMEVVSVDVTNFAPGKGDVLAHTRSKKDPSLKLDSSTNKPKPWIYEDGHWVASDCSAMKLGAK